jgi:hypothetical protein
MTTPDQLRAIVRYLQGRVRPAGEGRREVVFETPDADEMTAAGLDGPTVRRLLDSPWWPEMVEEIIETPDFVEPNETDEEVLEYARDVVREYVSKRFPLEG